MLRITLSAKENSMAQPTIRRAGAKIFMVRPDIKKHLALTDKVLFLAPAVGNELTTN